MKWIVLAALLVSPVAAAQNLVALDGKKTTVERALAKDAAKVRLLVIVSPT
jgi:hypothetical protein